MFKELERIGKKLTMKLTKYKLGDLIVQRKEKNNNYDVPIRGVSKEGFIPAKQKDADTSIYNVFYKYDFVFNPARMELNSIALNLEYDKALCSSLYEVFYVKDESIVLPEFLNLHIKRDEFARHCDYIGLGSAREYCRFANIAEFDIELPPIEVQQEIVEADRLIKKRIRLNNQMIQNLEATAQALYRKTFVDNIDKENLPEGWRMGTLGEVCSKIGSGATPKGGKGSYGETGVSLIRSMNVFDLNFCYDELAHISDKQAALLDGVTVIENDILFNITGASVARCCMVPKNVLPARVNQHVMIIRSKEVFMQYYILCVLCSEDAKCSLLGMSQSGSTREAITKSEIESFEIMIPPKGILKDFTNKTSPIFSHVSIQKQENLKLIELQSLLLAKMGQ